MINQNNNTGGGDPGGGLPPVVVFRNRIEPRPRKVEFETSLKAEIRDPLWMLTRQWQFGEFKGDDAGTPISGKVHLQSSSVNRFSPDNQNVFPYSDAIPLETRVEREMIEIDAKMSVKIGLQWFKLLNHFGSIYNSTTPHGQSYVQYNSGQYEALFLAAYSISLPSKSDLSYSATSPDLIEAGKLISNENAYLYLQSVQGKAVDGKKIFDDLLSDPLFRIEEVVATINGGLIGIISAHKNFVHDAGIALVNWFKKIYSIPETTADSSWDSSRLEYSFACTVPDTDSTNKTVLSAKEYYSGNLDWYSFDIDNATNASMTNPNGAINENVLENKTISLVPAPIKYSGMPNARYWAFEDAKVDFGNIDANTTDAAKILLAEFALMYSNDWFIIPFNVKTGRLCKIKTFTVKDVFGLTTTIESAAKGLDDETSGWRMFTLSTQNDPAGSLADTRLFFPPVIGQIFESEPIESVNLIRDEMANMVWAIEDKIPNGLSGSMSGREAANDFTKLLSEIAPVQGSNQNLFKNEALIKYRLANTVPENWIPFIPTHSGPINDPILDIKLQRASMPRDLVGLDLLYKAVKARGVILNEARSPYFIHEEEVPRSGVLVTRTFQRTRWKDGKIINWLGRRKQTGRGEGSSGLQFDTISPKKAE